MIQKLLKSSVLVIILILSSCIREIESTQIEENDKDILIPAIFNAQWYDFNSISNMSNEDIRNTIVVELNNRTNESVSYLQTQSNTELTGYTLLYSFLKIALILSETELINMTLGELRNTLIIENDNMIEAVKNAYKIAESKDSVLLSPACSSFDLFKSYEDRGHQFKNAVRTL